MCEPRRRCSSRWVYDSVLHDREQFLASLHGFLQDAAFAEPQRPLCHGIADVAADHIDLSIIYGNNQVAMPLVVAALLIIVVDACLSRQQTISSTFGFASASRQPQ
jgi:hypothetical protein